MSTEQLQALLVEVKSIQLALEDAVKAGPPDSPRTGAFAMATGWLVFVRRDLEQALRCETSKEETR